MENKIQPSLLNSLIAAFGSVKVHLTLKYIFYYPGRIFYYKQKKKRKKKERKKKKRKKF